MKKIIVFLLTICFIGELCTVNVSANNVQTKYLQISVNDNIQTYECLWDSENIYLTVENIGEITNYDWSQIDDKLEFQFFREYQKDNGNYGIELQTSVLIEVGEDQTSAQVNAMNESYTVKCYVYNEKLYLPLEEMLYLLHAEWTVNDNILNVMPLPLTILDFMAYYNVELSQIASKPEDILVDTGWFLSNTEFGQAVYSTVAEVFSDFDGKIFMLWWPGEGHVEIAECYEEAILQLAKNDDEFIGEDVQNDALEIIVDSIFSVNDVSTSKIQNIASFPSNVNDIIHSIPDAVSVLEGSDDRYPNIPVSDTVKNISEKIQNGEIDTSLFEIPELKSKADELGKVGDGIAILQCVWNVYETIDRVDDWDGDYLNQLSILANYENPGYINESVVSYVQSSAQRLIDSYNDPTQAATNEALQSTIGLLLSKTFDESPFGKTLSIMNAIGSCYGTFDVKNAEIYDVYSELSVVNFSIKIEQLVRELTRFEDILTTTEKLTEEKIEETRNQLMLYLRLNLRNKAQLYNLNIRGNKDPNWSQSGEAQTLHNEIAMTYAMIAELIETKDYDSRIIIDDNLDNLNKIDSNILMDTDRIPTEKIDIIGTWSDIEDENDNNYDSWWNRTTIFNDDGTIITEKYRLSDSGTYSLQSDNKTIIATMTNRYSYFAPTDNSGENESNNSINYRVKYEIVDSSNIKVVSVEGDTYLTDDLNPAPKEGMIIYKYKN